MWGLMSKAGIIFRDACIFNYICMCTSCLWKFFFVSAAHMLFFFMLFILVVFCRSFLHRLDFLKSC